MSIDKVKFDKLLQGIMQDSTIVSDEDSIVLEKSMISSIECEKIYLLAYNLYKQDSFNKALHLFRLLCLTDPLQSKFWKGFAACNKMLLNYNEAIKAYGILRLIEPDCAESSIHACHCYLKLQNKQQALDCIKDAKELLEMYQNKNSHLALYIDQLLKNCK